MAPTARDLRDLAERWRDDGDLLRTASECADELMQLIGEQAIDDSAWDRFWDAYPRKVAKREARKAWDRLAPDRATVDAIMADLRDRPALDEQWRTRRTTPHPATYLNGERWNDEWRTGAEEGERDRTLTPGQRVANRVARDLGR